MSSDPIADSMMTIEISTAEAVPKLIQLKIPKGWNITQALEFAGIEHQDVGIFSKPAAVTQLLTDGDRIELYLPLRADAKESRRRRASENPLRPGSTARK